MTNQHLLIGSVFLGGVASFLSPCILPIVPVYLGILSKGKKTILNTFLFILGLSLTFVSIGFSFSLLTGIFFNKTIKIIHIFYLVYKGIKVDKKILLAFTKSILLIFIISIMGVPSFIQ